MVSQQMFALACDITMRLSCNAFCTYKRMCLGKSLSGWTQNALLALKSLEHNLVVIGHMVMCVPNKHMMAVPHLY